MQLKNNYVLCYCKRIRMEVSGSSRSLEIPLKRPKVSDIPDTGAATPEPAPPVFNRKLRKAAVGTGCDIRLRVSVAGHPKPVLTWYHNDDPVPPSEAQDPGGLWIRDCGTSDAGLYTCVATNDLGEASCSAVLAIMDLGEAAGGEEGSEECKGQWRWAKEQEAER
uniref:Ig-like domain-containing protein n=1 Tax=Cynoglossus semilaevis TaxID=244447 RepID=A0A3P8V4C2_CYNSE